MGVFILSAIVQSVTMLSTIILNATNPCKSLASKIGPNLSTMATQNPEQQQKPDFSANL